LHILILDVFREDTGRQTFLNEWCKTFPEFNVLWIPPSTQFCFVTVVRIHLNVVTFSEDSFDFVLHFGGDF
jgi:hypothetical protein